MLTFVSRHSLCTLTFCHNEFRWWNNFSDKLTVFSFWFHFWWRCWVSWCRYDVKDDHTSVKDPDIMVVNCALSYIPKDNMKLYSQLILLLMWHFTEWKIIFSYGGKNKGDAQFYASENVWLSRTDCEFLQSLFNLKIIL